MKRACFKNGKVSKGKATVVKCYTKIGILQRGVLQYSYFTTMIKILENNHGKSSYLLKLLELTKNYTPAQVILKDFDQNAEQLFPSKLPELGNTYVMLILQQYNR